MKKSVLGLLFASLIAFSTGGCSSSSSSVPNETSAEWQKDIVILTIHDDQTVTSISDHTTMWATEYQSLWCKEWSASSNSHPQLTVRYRKNSFDDLIERRYAECWWIVTKNLNLGDVPGSDWSDSFDHIYLPDIRDNYGGQYLDAHCAFHKGVSAIWYKEWEWGNSGLRCLSVRYKFHDDDSDEMMRETRYVGCRYTITNKIESSSDSTSA